MDKPARIAILLLGGSSARYGGDTPKQLIPVNGKPLFLYALEALEKTEEVDSIFLVVKDGIEETVRKCVEGRSKIKAILLGGKTREASVKKGLDCISSLYEDDALVLIQDADRPHLSEKMIAENYAKAACSGAAVTAIPCSDSLFLSKDGSAVSAYLNRQEAYLAQTPQTFRLGLLKKAHEKEGGFTDDASEVSALGCKVSIVEGDPSNYKINTKEDMLRFQKEVIQ